MILVTGGTGLVGSHLLFHLAEHNLPIRAIHRPGSRLEQVEKVFSYYSEQAGTLFRQIEWVEADITDIPALEMAFDGIDQVYHSAAMISFDPKDYDTLMKVNGEGTANIVNLCISNKVKKLCYVSSTATIGQSNDGEMANEESVFSEQHANVYALSKYAAEMEVWRGSQEGLQVVLINPGIIVGPGFWKGGSGTLFTTAKKGYLYYPPGGTGFVSVNDVIRMMVGLMESKIGGERFLCVSENLSYREVLGLLAKNFGTKAPFKVLQFWKLEAFRLYDWIRHLVSNRSRRLTKNTIWSLRHREYYSVGKIGQHMNFKFEPIYKSIEYSCARFKEENLSA